VAALTGLLVYCGVGVTGGWLGYKLKIPAGPLVFAMVAVILSKLLIKAQWPLPRNFGFVAQIMLGVMVGAGFQRSILQVLHLFIFPILTSTLVLVAVGILLSLLFAHTGIMNISTAYLGTNPGAMTAMTVMAMGNQANATVVVCFHFFRVVFVILTAPFILKYLA